MEATWNAWSGPRPAQVARILAVAGTATLFLNTAAAVDLSYTVRLPYVLLAAASLVGFPFVVRGWTRAPDWIRLTALAVVATYVLASAVGDQLVLPEQRAGSHRDLVYLTDLVIGQALIGLVLGLWPARHERRELWTGLAVGAFAAGTYGVYQWFAQHYGLPLASLDTVHSNGAGKEDSLGSGLLGWERIHGTFPEPHSLAAYLVSCLPLGLLVVARARGRARWLAGAGLGACLASLVLTVSVPPWGILAAAIAVSGTLYAAGRGWTGVAAAAAGIAVVVCTCAPIVSAQPTVINRVTQRSVTDLEQTSDFRLDTWRDVRHVWSQRPALGYGAGQSSVRLARELDESGQTDPRMGLPSAQGLWAASLVDAGLLGLEAWAFFLGGILVIAGAALLRRPDALGLACFAAVAAAILIGQIGEDRLDLTAWVLIGLALAATLRESPDRDGGRSGG